MFLTEAAAENGKATVLRTLSLILFGISCPRSSKAVLVVGFLMYGSCIEVIHAALASAPLYLGLHCV